ncbi:methylsterol monooxygenase 2-2, partial [Quercus suber]
SDNAEVSIEVATGKVVGLKGVDVVEVVELVVTPDPISDEGDDFGAEESWLGTNWVLSDEGGRTSRCTPDAGTGPSHTASHEGTFPAQTTSRGASIDYEDPPRMSPPIFSGSAHDGECIFVPTPSMPTPPLVHTKNNSPATQEKCITCLLLYHFGVNLLVMLLSYPDFKFMGMRSSLPLPSWYLQVLYILKFLCKLCSTSSLRILYSIGDIGFCIQNGYTNMSIVSIMSKYATPFGLTSEYAHPAEILFLCFATIVGPAITRPHLITLWLWMVLKVLRQLRHIVVLIIPICRLHVL